MNAGREAAAPAGAAFPLLAMQGIRKTFPGVVALDRVDLAVRRGDIHAVVGENGAGKSTLMKILSGVYPYGSYEGEILFEGEVRRFHGIRDSEAAGIVIIHQELALVPLLPIAENLFLGNEQTRGGLIDRVLTYRRARELLAQVGLSESPETLITHLGVGKQQLVEIAKALAKKVKLLILDEPTAALNETESAALLDLLVSFKERGITSILITHKLHEVARVADAVTVLRDGRTIATLDRRRGDGSRAPLDEDHIIRLMVGRPLENRFPPRTPRIGEVHFEIRDWRVEHPLDPGRMAIRGIDLFVRRGEIVGLAGLVGAGRTELAMSVFGESWGRKRSGEVRIGGRVVPTRTVGEAVAAGIAYVPEDRKALGLILEDTIQHNVTLAHLEGVARRGFIDLGREYEVAETYRRRLRIRCASTGQNVIELSGGNQQKVVLSKWLFAEPEVLILDEPTRGIDVGAKYEIYAIMTELAAAGKCLLVISSDMPELLGLCDRIYVMNEGRLVAEFDRAGASQEAIMRAIVRAGHD